MLLCLGEAWELWRLELALALTWLTVTAGRKEASEAFAAVVEGGVVDIVETETSGTRRGSGGAVAALAAVTLTTAAGSGST